MYKFILKNCPRVTNPWTVRTKKRKDITSIDLFKDNFALVKNAKTCAKFTT